MARNLICSRPLWFCFALLALAPWAHAVDGVVLINQGTSVKGLPGCPHSGFPIIICKSGSYRLSGNLTISGVNTDGIDITANNVTLDLNGFTISGPVTCKIGTPVTCSASGSSSGVSSSGYNTTVKNGTVSGMGSYGVFTASTVEDVHVQNIGNATGVGIVSYGTVTRCTVTVNAGDGIQGSTASVINLNAISYNAGDGIREFGGGGVASDNTIVLNGKNGIEDVALSVNNTIAGNQGYGISSFAPYLGYTGNTINNNMLGDVNGATSMGHNLCDGVAC